MRYTSRHGAEFVEGDMTPMIDMTFQLIAFFMVLINFSKADQNELIKLPPSELARPPEVPASTPLTLHVTNQGLVIFGADETSIEGIGPLLSREKQLLELRDDDSVQNVTVIIRADREAKTGQVQELIEVCQKTGFENFNLRAKYQQRGTVPDTTGT